MPYSEDFLMKIEGARRAVGDLLRASDPGSWMGLRAGWREMGDALAWDRAERKRCEHDAMTDAEARQVSRHRRSDSEVFQREHWRGLGREERVQRLLTIIGDGQKTIREMVDRLNEGKPDGQQEIYREMIAPLVQRMTDGGELLKVGIGSHGSRSRYAYRRNRDLSPELRALEQSLSSGQGE